nr:PREDICTED: deleted in malignant brain tumors 1 protein [Anolis carolinensis]|eukprot:XP_008104974.2 PREDICTED: deleted in malignant brain tumors 1 protein [Anolis carolinensis]
MKNAQVVCRQLGCGNAVQIVPWPRFGQGSGRILLDGVQCEGDEAFLWDCKNRGWGVHSCTHQQDATILCQEEIDKPTGTVGDFLSFQLEGGPNRCAGRVEVTYFASWRTVVCSEEWDIKDAEVFCRQLGCGHALSALTNGFYGEGTGGPLLTKVHCSGEEDYLLDCSHEYRPATCGNYMHAGVICSDSGVTPPELKDFEIQLVNSCSPCEGRVEVYYNGTWGTVCDDDWDIKDAQVVCKELGCGDAVSAPGEAHFGEGNGNTWLSNLQCEGTESYLWQCEHLGWGIHGCHPEEDASVICTGPH